ncbi:hypothetical protein LSG31_15740 [Fodinisporobacter ferrooxydans]|uniref:Uncharacterized protein n=1 Tax=Fodinisporobacter ferrooxydans TaxID=2901836 RepID=A0ABY4CJK9_9BACL|nr:hypothetical protein LSG31_15740 [Alicyclobacillaceae bacterium MYW30-H2]
MEKEQQRNFVIQKVADEFDLEYEFVNRVLAKMESESDTHSYGHQTITSLVTKILDLLDQDE